MLLLLTVLALVSTDDVFIPPVPRGIAREGKTRTAKQPIPFPREDQRWIRVRTRHFDVISSATEARTRDIAGDLESVAAALTANSPRFQAARVPTTVFVFASRRESQPYFDLLTGVEKTGITGMHIRHGSGAAMFVDGARRAFERTAIHELVHDLLRQGDVFPPLWIEEGLAEYIANAQVTKTGVAAGAPIDAHVLLLASKPTRTVQEMFAVKAETEHAMSSYFYAQSWAAVHWLMQVDPQAFFPFLRDLENGTAVEIALRTHFEKSPDDLQRGIHAHGRSASAVKLAARVPPVTAEAVTMDRATLLYELGSFLDHVSGAENESARHFREALRIDPKHARTLAALGDFESAIAADPNDAHVHLAYAESLLGLALGDFAGVFATADLDTYRHARRLAAKALNLGADEARCRAAIGVSYLPESDVSPGVVALELARELAPWRMDYAIHLYAFHLRTGARDKADALFASVFEKARDPQVAFAARNVLLQHETDRANELARTGKVTEAAAIVRRLAATISEPATRADMERQAADLEAVALVNGHIQRYNEAIALSNTGRKSEALELLEGLLLVATDAQVVRDAQRLRSDLKRR